jgi:hypothetical protein
MRSLKRSIRKNQRAGSRVSKGMNLRRKSVRKSRSKSLRKNRTRKSKGILAQIGGFVRDLTVAPSGGFRVQL